MFKSIKTSEANKEVVTELTRKLGLGPENIIARMAYAYSLSMNVKLKLSEIQDAKGKEYSINVLFGNNASYYIALVCTHYNIYKTDKDIAKYVKMHIDHGLQLLNEEFISNPNITGFEFLVNKVDSGLQSIV